MGDIPVGVLCHRYHALGVDRAPLQPRRLVREAEGARRVSSARDDPSRVAARARGAIQLAASLRADPKVARQQAESLRGRSAGGLARQRCRRTRFSSISWRPEVGRGSRSVSRALDQSCSRPRRRRGSTSEGDPLDQPSIPVVDERPSAPSSIRRRGAEERAGERVHAADVRVEEIGRIDALATQLRVEVEPAVAEAATVQDLVEREGHLLRRCSGNWSVSQPFCGSPRFMSIDPKMPVRDRVRDLVLEAVSGQASRGSPRCSASPRARGRTSAGTRRPSPRRGRTGAWSASCGFGSIRIVPRKPILCLCSTTISGIGRAARSRGEVGVQQRLVALAAAPQHVVLTAETVRRLEHVLHLRGGIRRTPRGPDSWPRPPRSADD